MKKKCYNLYKLLFLQCFLLCLCCFYVFSSDADALAEMSEYEGMSAKEICEGVLEFIPQLGYRSSEQTQKKLTERSEEGLKKLYGDLSNIVHQRTVDNLRLERIAKFLSLAPVQSSAEGLFNSFLDDVIIRRKLEEFNLPEQAERRAERTQRVEKILQKAKGPLN
ncbi:MAG TPA: hypothetical protein DIC42_06030 [Holosporales bacterium]|nr:hypothetical protein [Holosporales bacterium]